MSITGQSTAELILPSGRVMLMEAPVAAGVRDVGVMNGVSISDFLVTLEELCSLLLASLRSVAPTEAEIEMSVAVEASTGRLLAFAADGSVSGAMKVRLAWKSGGDGDD